MTYHKTIMEYAEKQVPACVSHDTISDELFAKYGVNRGLRDINGKGVLTGLTNISKIVSFKEEKDGTRTPCDGELWYRGYNVRDLVRYMNGKRFGFERTAYLLLFGELPGEEDAVDFIRHLARSRSLPTNFTRDVIMKAPGRDIMSSMTRSILTLASYDPDALSAELADNLRQCIMLIATFPMLAVYGYHAYNHYENNQSMYIHHPLPRKSTAENILRLLRPDGKFSPVEAEVLDVALMLHMEHGGGNNSTFTTHVITSSGSDTYATMAAAMSSLKGPRHGGANIKVMEMMEDIREHVRNYEDEDAIRKYLTKMIRGKAFDGKGLIYGMGHAVYSVSDPREQIFKSYVTKLAEAKGCCDELLLYNNIEKIAPEVIAAERHIYKGVSPNVDFYSGFVYSMLGIPVELYTPLFAIARIVGWSAHRLEELVGNGKIIRPAYMSIMKERKLVVKD
ncbi:MAG: citrate/2-methylcitrate synthase [Lachnospiraceae bacterium]|nr:citrate/2-methylcitrate synthase [Lachnospiraceae bacterium]